MTKRRDNQAARLSDILELIQARRQSGLLSVERFEDGRFDEGDIYFEHGQPVYAQAGSLMGEEALNWLTNWRQVYFAFAKGAPHPDQEAHSSQLMHQKIFREDSAGYRPSSSDVPSSGREDNIPQKLTTEQGVLSLPLTRPQRSIYLLVDGRRTIADLARCTSRSVQEVQQLLSDLQEHGLISPGYRSE